MTNIETRVTEMRFDNAQFEAAVKKTIATIHGLNKTLQLPDASKGIEKVAAASDQLAKNNRLADAADHIAGRFKAMSVVGITAIASLTTKVIDSGSRMIKSLTIDPVLDGFREYETQLNAVQTILANTTKEGTNLRQVNEALDELNTYSDQTIYNFSEMAENIGTFTAAGVKLKPATEAIKGIANLAAISGSSAEQASTAMYQLSQALSAGRATLEDWNSVVNAGMGGQVFQDSLMETARVHGVAIDKMIKDAGSFRLTLQKGWLTSEILTETLQKFTGDLNAQQLKNMGYTEQQIVGIMKMAETAQNAATKVKTFTQLISTLQEAASSGWSATWRIIFGDFEEAKATWTAVNSVLGGFISSSAEARNKVLKDWDAMGGRKVVIEAIANAFKALVAVVKPINSAFREIFPAKTGRDLYNLSVSVRNFTEGLLIGSETADKLKRTFAGVFAALAIGGEIIKQVVGVLFSLFSTATEGSSAFLDTTANFGDFLVALKQSLVDGKELQSFFAGLRDALSGPVEYLRRFVSVLSDALSADLSGLDEMVKHFDHLSSAGEILSDIWSRLGDGLSTVFETVEPMVRKAIDALADFGTAVSDMTGNLDFDQFITAVNTGLLASLSIAFSNFLGKTDIVGSGGLVDGITEAFGELTGTLEAMQLQLKAGALLKIASAVGLLTASVVALSLIDSQRLEKALSALGAVFAQLVITLALFTKATLSASLLQLPLLSVALVGLAIAINLLTVSIMALGSRNWGEISRGLTGMAGALAALVLATKLMSTNSALMIRGAAGLLLLSTAVKVLASALTDLSGLSWEELGKGLAGVSAVLGALGIFSKFASVNAGGVLGGAGIVLLAAGIKILAGAIEDISGMSWGDLARGLTGMAAGLTAVGLALTFIPPTAVLSGAGILVAAAALKVLALALKSMAEMSWGEIGKSITILAASLTLISLALITMTAALPGAAALAVVAASLLLLVPVLQQLGNMSWGEIVKGLFALAGVFAVVGAAGLLLTPLVPILVSLAGAIALLGAGVALIGVGLIGFSLALTALSVSGVAAAAALVGIVTTLLGAVPKILDLVKQMLVGFAQVVTEAAPALFKAAVTFIGALLDAVTELAPKIALALLTLLLQLLTMMNAFAPRISDSAARLIIALLKGMESQIPKIVPVAVSVIVAFMKGLGDATPRLLNAAADLIIKFVNALAGTIRSRSDEMGRAGTRLAFAIIEGMVRGLTGGADQVVREAKRVALNAFNAAKNALGVKSPSKKFAWLGRMSVLGWSYGLKKTSDVAVKASEEVGADSILAMAKTISGMRNMIDTTMDVQPRITPVMDMSQVAKGAATLSSLIPAQTSVSAKLGYSMAKSARVGYDDNSVKSSPGEADGSPSLVSFTQNNYSPKALTNAEIYRQTKNQISKAKEALTT